MKINLTRLSISIMLEEKNMTNVLMAITALMLIYIVVVTAIDLIEKINNLEK